MALGYKTRETQPRKWGRKVERAAGGEAAPRGVYSCREALGVSSARFRAVVSFRAEIMWPWNKRHTTRNGGGRSRARRGERTAPHGVAVELERR